MLLKITPNEIILEHTFKITFHTIIPSKIPQQDSHSNNCKTSMQFLHLTVLFSVKYLQFHFNQYLCISKNFALNTVFIMRNQNRRSRKVESQPSDKDENTSETSFTQGNATSVDVSENVNNIFDRNLGSEQKEPSQINNEIEAITQRLSEQNNNKITQIEQPLNNKFEEILKEIRTNRKSNLVNDEEDAENIRPSTSTSENKLLRRKHASNNEIDEDRNQDNRFQSSVLQLRQPSTSFGVANETLGDTIIITENRQENADYHMMIGGLGIAEYHMVTEVGFADYHMVTGVGLADYHMMTGGLGLADYHTNNKHK